MKRTKWYAAMTKDEAQNSRMTFLYEAVNLNEETTMRDAYIVTSVRTPG